MSTCQFSASWNRIATGDDAITYAPTPPPGPNPNLYGLTTFDLNIDPTVESPAGMGAAATITINTQDTNLANKITIIVNVDAFNNFQSINGILPNPDFLVQRIAGTRDAFTIRTLNRPGSPPLRSGVVWYLKLDTENNSVTFLANPCPLVVAQSGTTVIEGPTPPTEQGTSITIFAQLSNNQAQLCQVDFTIVNPQGTCQKQCNAVTTQEYRLYCPPLASVVCAPGCTLLAKVTCLAREMGLDVQTFYFGFLRYALLRLALSKLLFGQFNVKYLQQKYYAKFLRGLQRCYAHFIPFFTSAEYKTCWQFFTC